MLATLQPAVSLSVAFLAFDLILATTPFWGTCGDLAACLAVLEKNRRQGTDGKREREADP